MSFQVWHYFKSLCDRAAANSAECVYFEPGPHDGWEPPATKCHENAIRFASLAPGRIRVCGWLITGSDSAGGYIFAAHSVVEERGRLHDITPSDALTNAVRQPEHPRLFLRHEGTTEEFDAMRPRYNYVPFNPSM